MHVRGAQLTFRDLKTYISEKLNIPYAALKLDALSAIIEDATDAITNVCRSGRTPLEECKRLLEPGMFEMGKGEVKEEV